MEQLVAKYADKMVRAGLCEAPIVAGLDHELVFSREDEDCELMRGVFERMNISGLVLGRPAEPFGTIIDQLAVAFPDGFAPRDTETRTFLHELPVIRDCTPDAIAEALGRRKSVIVVREGGAVIVTHGSVTPEQAFVTFSSVCFSSFVLFFSEYLRRARAGSFTPEWQAAYDEAVSHLEPVCETVPPLAKGPFQDRETMLAAMAEAGRATVDYKLVDSYFGNISCRMDDTLWISETGSSLDELEGLIDPCPLDGSSTACLTASSELTAHQGVYEKAGGRSILHGHPRFTVILSMDCPDLYGNDTCDAGIVDLCHIKCTKKRYVPGLDEGQGNPSRVPVVPGEVGTGPYGLCHTLPPAMSEFGSAVVWGHGLFTLGEVDFCEPFAKLLGTENACRREYFRLVEQALKGAKQD